MLGDRLIENGTRMLAGLCGNTYLKMEFYWSQRIFFSLLSGKSETATALSEFLTKCDISNVSPKKSSIHQKQQRKEKMEEDAQSRFARRSCSMMDDQLIEK